MLGSVEQEILYLSEEEFWKLVSVRLNTPLSTEEMRTRGIKEEERDYYSLNALIEELFLVLAQTKERLVYGNRPTTSFKYYDLARKLMKVIPIANPPIVFEVDSSDLSVRILAELKSMNKSLSSEVLKGAVGRLFENINSRFYHQYIAKYLIVRLREDSKSEEPG